MAFFKVGDRVTVRGDICKGRYYMENGSSWDGTTREMVKRAGKIVTIVAADDNGYRINEDMWHWTDEMFEEYLHRFDEAPGSEFIPLSEADLASFLCTDKA